MTKEFSKLNFPISSLARKFVNSIVMSGMLIIVVTSSIMFYQEYNAQLDIINQRYIDIAYRLLPRPHTGCSPHYLSNRKHLTIQSHHLHV